MTHEVIHPANPFAETEFYYMVSTSVGSGKTFAAVRMINQSDEPPQNYIYVAPTIALAEQTYRELAKDSERKVKLIHSEKYNNATERAIGTINDTTPNKGVVVVITTPTFLNIMSAISWKKFWKVILDEAFQPLDLLSYRSQEYMNLCMDLFTTDDRGRVKPADGKGKLVRSIATADTEHEQVYDNKHIKTLCEKVANTAIYCEWVHTSDAEALMSAYVAPDEFRGFQEVYFMSALFEQSVLYHLWTRQHGVEFQESQTFKEDTGIIDVHQEQGYLVRVGHLLHPDDKASKYNLMRNYKTGERYEERRGYRVIDRVLELAVEFFRDKRFIYQANNWFKGRWDLPEYAVKVSVMVHGQNLYRDHINAAALAVTNPAPEVVEWMAERTQLPVNEVYLAYRIHTTYQFFGRTGIRDRGDTRVKTLLTLGREDAEFIHRLFEGSEFLGQIGDLESMEARGLERRKEWLKRSISQNPEYLELRKKQRNVANKVKRGTAPQANLDVVKAEIRELRKRLRAELEQDGNIAA